MIRLATDHHVLFLTVHHIICDGWSCGVLLRDLGTLYEARTCGRAADLEAPMQISAYARWQEGQQSASRAAEIERYWVGLFEDDVPELDLPTDFQRPALKTYGASREEVALSSGLMEGLARVAKANGCTLFTVLLSAFEVFLSRLAQQADFVIGVSVAGQLATGHPELVAHSVNLLPVRTHVDLASTFDQHLLATRTRVLDALERQNFTFGTLLKKLQLPRDPSRVPVVSVVFNMDAGMTGLCYPGLTAESGSNPRSFENFELFVNVVTTDSGTRIECTYNTDLFAAETIGRRLDELVLLLSAAAATPHTVLCTLPWLTDDERETLLVRWNETDLAVSGASVVERVGQRVAADPDRAAVSGGGRRLTYGELWARAGRVARYLDGQGVGRGRVVGVSMERGPEMVVALLGVWRSGAAYLPLDPEFPAVRLSFMVADSGARLVLIDGDAPTSSWDIEAVTLAEAERLGAESDGEGETVAVTRPEDLAYMLYTSGSTGRPKGVEVEHGNLASFLEAMAAEPGLAEDDVMLAVTTLSFDIAGLELWLPLWVGARVEIAEREVTRDGDRLRQRLDASGATLMQATPSTWRMLLESGWAGRLAKILCGGEPFPRDLVEPLLERADEVWNMYGPTETTIWSTAHRVRGVDDRGVPIGRPIANTQVYVMDPHGRLTPQGVPGELWIGGRGVARGYHDRGDLTAHRFVACPFREGERVYRTGDLVRWRGDGLLEHLGRLDDQVKVHGHRIELGEIEAVLADHDDVRQAVATVNGRVGDARLVAFVVPEPGRPVIGSELRTFLRQRLPPYMVPGVIGEIDTVPLAPNGKVDRRALPDPTHQAGNRNGRAPAETPLEAAIEQVWTDVLSVGPIGVEDGFFELGGNSLQAVRVLNRLEQRLGVRLAAGVIFEHPTVRGIAAYMSTRHPQLLSGVPLDGPGLDREYVTL